MKRKLGNIVAQSTNSYRKMEADSLTLSSLPPEVLLEVFKWLPLKDKKTARLVCGLWLDLIDTMLQFHVSLTEQNLKYFKNFPNAITSVRMGNTPQLLELTPEDKKILAKVKYLELSNDPFNLKTRKNMSSNIEVMLRSCKNISSLRITGEFLSSVVLSAPLAFHKINLMNLTSLMINLDEIQEDVVLNTLSSLCAPNLCSLEFHRATLCHCCGYLFDLATVNAMFQLIKTHEIKLKTLKMTNTIAAVVRRFTYNPLRRLRTRTEGHPRRRLRVLNIVPVEDLPLPTLLDLKLETLEINHPSETFGSNWNLASAIVSSQNSLKSLKIVIKYFHFYQELMQLIRQNPLIEKLEIDQRVAMFGFNLPLLLDLENIRYCQNLQELHISASYIPQNISCIPRSLKIIHWSGRLGKQQIRYLASNLNNLVQVTLDHVFIDRPSDRYPHQGQRINSDYFDSNLLADFHRMPHLKTLRICDCDIRHLFQSLLFYCAKHQAKQGIKIVKGFSAAYKISADIEPCKRVGADFHTFTFTGKL